VAFETVRAHLEQIGVVPGKNIFLKILARTTAGKAYPLNEQILPQEELNPNEDN
jgi:hypothetical protein